MNLCYYFFKEHTRLYDKADILAFFQGIPEFRLQMNEKEYHLIYVNTILDFTAKFIIAEKSVVPNIQKLNPSYYDINIRLEIPLLLPTYKANLLFTVCQELCQKFKFFIYNELFEDISPFRRNMLVQAFNEVKKAYKLKYEEEFLEYRKAPAAVLENVYDYIVHKNTILEKYKSERVNALDYLYLGLKGDRNVLFAVRYDGFAPFIMPPHVDYIIYYDREVRYIKASELFAKCGKMLKAADTNVFGVTYVTLKDMAKLRKILKKARFTFVPDTFVDVEEYSILDL